MTVTHHISDPSAEHHLQALKRAPSEDDPGVYVNWNMDALEQFVQGANQQNVHAPQAAFISTEPGHMTITTCANDVMTVLENFAGGRHGLGLLAPNTLSQFANISRVMADRVEVDPWVQAVMVAHVPADQTLATVYMITDRALANAAPLQLAPVFGGRQQVFQ